MTTQSIFDLARRHQSLDDLAADCDKYRKGSKTMTNDKKHFGVVYTPDWTVNMILNKLPSLKDVAICDPSCGDGQFLVAVATGVCQSIQRCRNKASRDAYYATLQKLTGMEIDNDALIECKVRLNRVLRNYGCSRVKWKLLGIDAMDMDAWRDMVGTFDAVVGNPPYVRIQHLEAHRRDRISKGKWRLMRGCADLYILFYEMALELLHDGGALVFITPNSWMKTKSGKALRECLRELHEIRSIADFGDHQVFSNVTTYTAITEIRKSGRPVTMARSDKCTGFKNGIPQFDAGYVDTREDGWSVLSKRDACFINTLNRRKARLDDVANIHVGIQTLADDVFILGEGSAKIEKAVTRRVFKASVMKGGRDTQNRRVIYPYQDGKLLPEDVLRAKYPQAHAYLLRHKARLLARDKGATNPQKWYGYGREVSIVSAFGEKILTSAMNPAPNFQKCPDPDALFYSGYSIMPKSGVSLLALLDELNSAEMDRFIRLVSRPYRNNWYSYAKSFIQSFPVTDAVYV